MLSTHRNRRQRAQINAENRDNELRYRLHEARRSAHEAQLEELAAAMQAFIRDGERCALAGIVAEQDVAAVALDLVSISINRGCALSFAVCEEWLLDRGFGDN